MNSESIEDTSLVDSIALTAWIIVSVAVYLCGILIPWDAVWLVMGVILAPLYAVTLVGPIYCAFRKFERPSLATLWSLIYLGFYFYVVMVKGWWREPDTGIVAVWPSFLAVGGVIVATIASSPFVAITAIWDDYVFNKWLRGDSPEIASSAEVISVAPKHAEHPYSVSKRRLLKRLVAMISLLASILTIIGFVLQYMR